MWSILCFGLFSSTIDSFMVYSSSTATTQYGSDYFGYNVLIKKIAPPGFDTCVKTQKFLTQTKAQKKPWFKFNSKLQWMTSLTHIMCVFFSFYSSINRSVLQEVWSLTLCYRVCEIALFQQRMWNSVGFLLGSCIFKNVVSKLPSAAEVKIDDFRKKNISVTSYPRALVCSQPDSYCSRLLPAVMDSDMVQLAPMCHCVLCQNSPFLLFALCDWKSCSSSSYTSCQSWRKA